ncbi:MAG: hypothetical protein B7Z66_00885 [Chromatiales bacterium 21-64-14]|nr:MAG: hypothetical protein B7Z66_00885 [Chromatiales bacterium 21-64-14]HQU15587.1 EAL domain-containing protein [Gammaproteobacteria bacterium]
MDDLTYGERLRAVIAGLSELFAGGLPEVRPLRQALQGVTDAVGAEYGVLDLRNELGQEWFVATGFGHQRPATIRALLQRAGAAGADRPMDEADVAVASDRRPPRRAAAADLSALRNFLVLPVGTPGVVHGTLYLCNKRNGAPFTSGDAQFARHFAAVLGGFGLTQSGRGARNDLDRILQESVETVFSRSGEAFFQALVLHLVEVLDVELAMISEVRRADPDQIHTLAVSHRGRLLENFTYSLHKTPCEEVVGRSACYYPTGVRQRYPDDAMLAELGIDSYLGIPLFDHGGGALGLLVVADTKPLPAPSWGQSLVRIFAVRAAMELERDWARRALRTSEERLDAVVSRAPIVLFGIDRNGIFTLSEGKGLERLGLAPGEVVGRSIYELYGDNPETLDQFHRALSGEVVNAVARAGDASFDVWWHPLRDAAGAVSGVIGVATDATDRRKAAERLDHLAHYDHLTGLPNRLLFAARLEQAMAEAQGSERLVGLLFLDLDRFKQINDTLSHEFGDFLLKAVADRLQSVLRPGATLARLGGDEFGIILPGVRHIDSVTGTAYTLLDLFSSPFSVGGREAFITASIGITVYPFDDRDIDGMLKNADTAMYHAKEHGRNTYRLYTAELRTRVARRMSLETSLRHALERAEFLLYYQPQVDLGTGAISGAEALIRWQNPEAGLVAPGDFIPVAEDTGLIVPIGEWVLREACRQARAWRDAGLPPITVTVNLSARQLRQRNLTSTFHHVLEETGLNPADLGLELTESLLMENVEQNIRVMQALHETGVKFSIDDFGTGYSSLSYLNRFPLQTLKIDRSFVQEVCTHAGHAAIARAIIGLAHSLELEVIAEGVETRQQIGFLCANGCDGIQGYYFSRPVPAPDLAAMLRDARCLDPADRRAAFAAPDGGRGEVPD